MLVRSESRLGGPSETYKVSHQVRIKSHHFSIRRVQVHFVMISVGFATNRTGPKEGRHPGLASGAEL